MSGRGGEPHQALVDENIPLFRRARLKKDVGGSMVHGSAYLVLRNLHCKRWLGLETVEVVEKKRGEEEGRASLRVRNEKEGRNKKIERLLLFIIKSKIN